VQDAADLEPADDGEVEVEDDEVGHAFGDRLQRGIAGTDHLRVGLAAALEGVFDEAGDVLFVFDDEHTVFCHEARLAYRPDVSRQCLSC